MSKILVCFGTRPEWIKIKPIIEQLDNVKLLFTGQHPDILKDIKTDYRINIKDTTNRLDQIISDCLLQFPNDNFEYVLVHGDTVSALACALAAYSRGIKIGHIEAGLRSYNLKAPFPEEGYRQMISRIANINFAPTHISADNLKKEKVNGDTYVVGNSVLDNLVKFKSKTTYSNKVLVTLHRWENHNIMDKWFNTLNRIAEKHSNIEFIIPLHHNPNVQKHKHLLKNLQVVPAMPHNALINLLKDTLFVITDSGGLQEEGAFFNKKVVVCRDVTERPEGIDSGHLLLCPFPSTLESTVDNLVHDYQINKSCPYGDGDTGVKIKQILDGSFNKGYSIIGAHRTGSTILENIAHLHLYKVKGRLKKSHNKVSISSKSIVSIRDPRNMVLSILRTIINGGGELDTVTNLNFLSNSRITEDLDFLLKSYNTHKGNANSLIIRFEDVYKRGIGEYSEVIDRLNKFTCIYRSEIELERLYDILDIEKLKKVTYSMSSFRSNDMNSTKYGLHGSHINPSSKKDWKEVIDPSLHDEFNKRLDKYIKGLGYE